MIIIYLDICDFSRFSLVGILICMYVNCKIYCIWKIIIFEINFYEVVMRVDEF